MRQIQHQVNAARLLEATNEPAMGFHALGDREHIDFRRAEAADTELRISPDLQAELARAVLERRDSSHHGTDGVFSTGLSDRDRKKVSPLPTLAEGDRIELRVRRRNGQDQTVAL